jgi:hypothetical protein
MKRFELWLTTVIMFSLHALVFAQATGGSPGKQGKLIRNGTAAGTGRKGTVEPEFRKKGTGNAQKKGVTVNQPLPPIHAADKGSGNPSKKGVTISQPPPSIIHATDKGSGNPPKKGVTISQPPPSIIHATDKGSGNPPKKGAPIIHATDKGSGNGPKTTGPTTPPPKAGNPAGKIYRKGSGTGRKGKVEQTDGGKKPAVTQQ